MESKNNKEKPLDKNQEVIRVFIEEKSLTAYKRPLVEKPEQRLEDIKTVRKENYPNQPGTKLPDVFPDLPEKTKKYLKLGEYGNNIIINKKYISRLLSYYFESKDLKLPVETHQAFRNHMELLRELLNMCTLDEADERTHELFKGSFKPTYPAYSCKCENKKRK